MLYDAGICDSDACFGGDDGGTEEDQECVFDRKPMSLQMCWLLDEDYTDSEELALITAGICEDEDCSGGGGEDGGGDDGGDDTPTLELHYRSNNALCTDDDGDGLSENDGDCDDTQLHTMIPTQH